MPEAIIRIPKLHTAQMAVEEQSKRFGVLHCGRRWGKTTFGRNQSARTMIGSGAVGYFTPTYKLGTEFWRWAIDTFAPITKRKSEQERSLELVNGGRLDCWTLDKSDAGRGRSYDLAILDEAAFAPKLQDMWQAAIRPTLADRKGRAWFLTTPRGREFSYTLYLLGQSGDPEWFSARMGTVTNPYIDPEEVEAARKSLPPDAFAEEWLGEPQANAANPFGMEAIAACVGPLSGSEPVAFGIDLAQAEDWTVVIGIDKQGHVCRFDRWQHTPWGETIERVAKIVGGTPALVDSTGVGGPVFEQIQAKCRRAEAFVYTSSSKQPLMHELRTAIQERTVTFPDNEIRSELDAFEYQYSDKSRTVKYSAPSGMHDDCVCALAQAVRMSHTLPAEPYVSVISRTKRTRGLASV